MEDRYSKSNSNSMSEDIRDIAQAFIRAKKNFSATGKNAKGHNYTYAKIEDIYNAVEEHLLNEGIAIWHYDEIHVGKEVVCTRLVHSLSGQWLQDTRFLESEKPGNQAKGSASTYMKKYALLSLCSIAQEDDDGQSEEKYIAANLINTVQLKELQLTIKLASNALNICRTIYSNYRIKDLSQLKSEQYAEVMDYVINNSIPKE